MDVRNVFNLEKVEFRDREDHEKYQNIEKIWVLKE